MSEKGKISEPVLSSSGTEMTEEEKETLIRLLQKVEHNAETAWRLARTGKEKPL